MWEAQELLSFTGIKIKHAHDDRRQHWLWRDNQDPKKEIRATFMYYHYKVANQLADEAGMIFAEDLNLKELSERVHSCSECGYTTDRDVAAQVVVQLGTIAVGHTV